MARDDSSIPATPSGNVSSEDVGKRAPGSDTRRGQTEPSSGSSAPAGTASADKRQPSKLSLKKPTVGTSLKELRFYLPFLKPVRLHIVAIIVLSFLGSVLVLPSMSLPKVLLSQLDAAEPSGPLVSLAQGLGEASYVIVYLVFALACLLLSAAVLMLRTLFSSRAGEHVLRTLREKLFRQIEHLPMSAILSTGSGRYVQNMSRDVFQIRSVIGDTLTQTIEWLLRLIVYLGWLFFLEPGLTLVLIALLLVAVPLVRHCNRRVENWASRVREISETLLNQLVEAVGGYRDLKAAGRFEQVTNQFASSAQRAEQHGVRTVLWSQMAAQTVSVVTSLVTVLPYFLYQKNLSDPATLGTLLTYTWVWAQVFPVIRMLTFVSADLAVAAPSMRSVREVLQSGDGSEAGNTIARSTRQANELLPIESIRFEEVGVCLSGRWIVRNLDFELPGGKLSAIVGESGSGKTTLFNLLTRLLTPTEGRIFINDCPLDEIDESALRQLIGYIPQNPFIFNSSIRDNFLIRPDESPDLSPIVADAQLSNLVERRHEEGGLEAPAGFQGMMLSAGERQRVALARLLIQNPAIIISDEYTANIDIRTARLIQEMMRNDLADRTRVTISHELYTIKGADYIVVLEQGRIERSGTHDELLAIPGLYKSLWEAQSLAD